MPEQFRETENERELVLFALSAGVRLLNASNRLPSGITSKLPPNVNSARRGTGDHARGVCGWNFPADAE